MQALVTKKSEPPLRRKWRLRFVGEDGGRDKACWQIAPGSGVGEVRKVTLARRYRGRSKTLAFFVKFLTQRRDSTSKIGIETGRGCLLIFPDNPRVSARLI